MYAGARTSNLWGKVGFGCASPHACFAVASTLVAAAGNDDVPVEMGDRPANVDPVGVSTSATTSSDTRCVGKLVPTPLKRTTTTTSGSRVRGRPGPRSCARSFTQPATQKARHAADRDVSATTKRNMVKNPRPGEWHATAAAAVDPGGTGNARQQACRADLACPLGKVHVLASTLSHPAGPFCRAEQTV